eukprot:1188336-Prorocentrum_minimum.AAC.6
MYPPSPRVLRLTGVYTCPTLPLRPSPRRAARGRFPTKIYIVFAPTLRLELSKIRRARGSTEGFVYKQITFTTTRKSINHLFSPAERISAEAAGAGAGGGGSNGGAAAGGRGLFEAATGAGGGGGGGREPGAIVGRTDGDARARRRGRRRRRPGYATLNRVI